MAVLGVACVAPRGASELPAAARPVDEPAASAAERAVERAIEAQPVCIGSTVHSAGELGGALLYRHARLPDGRLEVGYYAFFSEERPWGNNWLTWSVVPALALDLVYTRGLLVGPGIQRAAYGRADVEGFRVIYALDGEGGLRVESAVADDDHHQRRDLTPRELFAADPERITLATDTWSHHLGARVERPGDLVYRRCYGPRTIRPIDREAVRRFNLDRRAWPAAALGAGRAAGVTGATGATLGG
jgi:hypothetical protein